MKLKLRREKRERERGREIKYYCNGISRKKRKERKERKRSLLLFFLSSVSNGAQDPEDTLLVAVGEVVVAGAHVRVSAIAELEDAALVRREGVVELVVELLGAGGDGELVLRAVKGVIVAGRGHAQSPVALGNLPVGAAADVARGRALARRGLLHLQGAEGVLEESEEGVVLPGLRERGGKVVGLQLDPVVAVGAARAFTGVASLAVASRVAVVVRVGAGPLDVQAVAVGDGEVVGREIVLDGRVGLHNVAALAAHVEVPQGGAVVKKVAQLAVVARALAHDRGDHGGVRGVLGPGQQAESVRAVLESAAKLGRVDGQLQGLVGRANVDVGVLADGRVDALAVVLVEGGVDAGVVVVVRGDVVAQAHHAAEGLVARLSGAVWQDAVWQAQVRDGPVVRVHLAVAAVAVVVDARPRGLQAVRRRDAVSRVVDPAAAVALAGGGLGVLDAVGAGGGVAAEALGLDVLALRAEKLAVVQAVSHDGNVAPRARVPVRVVVALLRALVAAAVVVGVLAGEDGRGVAQVVVGQVLVGREEAAVALAAVALVVVLPVLVQPLVGVDVAVVAGKAASRRDVIGVGRLREALAVGVEAVAQTRPIAARATSARPAAPASAPVSTRPGGPAHSGEAVVLVVDAGRAPQSASRLAAGLRADVQRRAERRQGVVAPQVARHRPVALLVAVRARLLHVQDSHVAAPLHHLRQAHVLQDDGAVELVRVAMLVTTATVLVGPLHMHDALMVATLVAHKVALKQS
jgi:hypothetical protein